MPAFFLHIVLGLILVFFKQESQVSSLLFTVVYEAILAYYIFYSYRNRNKISLILAISYALYFYQVPFIGNFSMDSPMLSYNIISTGSIVHELYTVYFFISIMMFFVIKQADQIRIDFTSQEDNPLLVKLFFSSLFLSVLLVIYAFINANGFSEYMKLNKLEASEIQNFFYLSYQPFALMAMVCGLWSRNKSIHLVSYFFIFLIVMFDIMTARRFMILASLIIVFLLRYRDFKLKAVTFIWGYGLLFAMSLVKFIYYPFRNLLTGNLSSKDINSIKFSSVFHETFFSSETHAHIMLLANFLKEQIKLPPVYFLKQLIVGLPFGWQLVPSYKTAGDLLRLHYNVEWGGLASSFYIIPFISLGFGGILVAYLILILLLRGLKFLINQFPNSILPSVFVLINAPILLFYYQREELILITKTFFTYAFALSLAYYLSLVMVKKSERISAH